MRGFTLIELLAVMVILSIAMGMTVVFIGKGGLGDDLKLSARKVIAAARQTRSVALSENRDVVLQFDTAQGLLGTDDFAKKTELPDGILVSVVAAKSEQTAKNRAGIRFFPDGGSTGGRVTLSAGDRKLSVVIDWLSGRTFVEDSNAESRSWTKR